MAQSSQAKEVILEIGEELGAQIYTVQVQSGTVKKTIFDDCVRPQGCSTDVLNANSSLEVNWNDWYRLECNGLEQIGNAPQVYPGGGVNPSYQMYAPNASMIYAYDYTFDSILTEGVGIVFDFLTAGGLSPDFNGVFNSVNAPQGLNYVNNLLADGNADTEQGRMLYAVPKASSGITTRISFEILEGNGRKLLVRGSGGKSIGQYLSNNGFSQFPPGAINSPSWWSMFDFYISPYVHGGNWYYDNNGHINYDDSIQTVHASFVPAPNGTENFASMVQDTKTFGLRSTHDIFNCFEGETQGYELTMSIDSMTNCVVDVLTYTDNNNYDFAFTEAGVSQTGTDFVWEKISTTGNHTVCVPFHYNTIDTEEQYNPNVDGAIGGWSTSIQIQTGGGGFLSGQIAKKIFYEYQYKILRVTKIDNSLPASLEISRFELRNSSHNTRQIDVPTYIDRQIKVETYDYNYLDIFDRDKIPLALTFNSGDLRDPSKRSTGYSKTFELPASNRNNKFLKVLTADGSHRDEADIRWRKARIRANGIVAFQGWARIEQTDTGSGGRYSCHILQDPAYWPEIIGDKNLCDLTFPQHEKSYATVTASWSDSVDNIPYVYPAINYGKWSKDTNDIQTAHSINDFHPALYVKAVVDKIFLDAGYTLSSNFFNSVMFKKLIIPYTSDEDYNASQSDALGEDGDYSAHASLAAQQSLPYIAGPPLFAQTPYVEDKWFPSIPCQNGCNLYSPGGGNSAQNGYVVPFTGRYEIYYQATAKLNHPSILCGNGGNSLHWSAWVLINGLAPLSTGYSNISGNNGIVHVPNPDLGPGNLSGVANANYSAVESDNNWMTRELLCEIDLVQGDEIQIGWFGVNHKQPNCGAEARVIDQDFAVWPVVEQAYVPPYQVSLSKSLDCGVKQLDLLKGLTELYNLYWTSDEETKTISVEPYDDFYGSGVIKDWSQKIDRTSWSDKFVIEDLAKTVRYKYKEDNSDDLVAVYNQDMDTELWSVNITNDNLYRKENTTLGTTVFSPTFRIKAPDGVGSSGDKTFSNVAPYPVMPCMWSGDPVYWGWFNNQSRPDNSTNFNIRILNYHGLSNATGSWELTDDNGNPAQQNSYPYAYTYNYNHSGAGAIEDNLSWYGIGDNMTGVIPLDSYQRGLFDKYYGRLYEKISGGAALRTCMMDLTAVDISQFDFRNIIKITMDGGIDTYWTVHKIIDYAPGKDKLTKVELVEWKYGFGTDKKFKPTNYGGIKDGGKQPTGGKGFVTDVNGDTITVQDNGVYYTDSPGVNVIESSSVKTSNNLTAEILKSNPQLENFTSQSPQKLISSNQYNGLTNNPALVNPAEANDIKNNGIALGTGLTAFSNQTVLGSYNTPTGVHSFQVGGGYRDERTGKIERLNAISVTKDGDVSIYGGEVVAEFSTKDLTITGDVYYTAENGEKRKVYLKERTEKRYYE